MKFDRAVLIIAWVFIVSAVRAMRNYGTDGVVDQARKLADELEPEQAQLKK